MGQKVYSYEFAWDSWKNTGQRGPFVNEVFGVFPGETTLGEPGASSGWESSAHETFYNSDFANLLKKLLVGELTCEGSGETHFYHNIKAWGYQNNTMGYKSEDSKGGACSNLVHHVTYAGWGWDGPEHEKTSLEFPAVIASHEYEEEAGEEMPAHGVVPTVNTLEASDITGTNAWLSGQVNPENLETHCHFEYGTSEVYGASTSEVYVGNSNNLVAEAQQITGLQPNTTYHYRLVASNSAGTTYGADQTFTTPRPPTATTEPATGVTYDEAILHGTVNPQGFETTYQFEICSTEQFGCRTAFPSLAAPAGSGEESVAVSTAATSLNFNTRYYYRTIAANGGGTAYGEARSFTTPYPPPEVRSKPAAYVGPTIATLYGEVRNYGGASRTTYFEYGPSISYGSRTPEVKEGSFGDFWEEVEVALTSLAPNTTYHYRTVSYTNGGTTYSKDATFTTLPSPSAVTESPSGISLHEATIGATINPGGHSTTYQVEYWPTGKSGEAKSVPASAEAVGSGTANVKVSQKLTGLTGRTSYTYRVRATNSLATTYGTTATLVTVPAFASEPTANPEGSKEASFSHVACASPTTCIAAGESQNPKNAFLELWNGATWTAQSLPALPETHGIVLGAVSCDSTKDCWAVGSYEKTGGGGLMSEHWNGSTWAVESIPVPSGSGFASLRALSCRSAIECTAVGQYEPNGKVSTLIEQLGSGGWWTPKSPNQTGAEGSTLLGVSCPSAYTCTAVGEYTYFESESSEIHSKILVEHWAGLGNEWTIQSAPNPEGNNRDLESVSCTSASLCMAVGNYGIQNTGKAPSTHHTLAEQWNGTEWTVLATPQPPSSSSSGLSSVSCTTPSACTATGGLLAETWNGTEWVVSFYTPPTAENIEELNAVSCATTSCTVVGGHDVTGGRNLLASALSVPVAETTGPTAVTNTSATLNGTLNPYGYETTYQFEYGPTQAYGTKSPATEAHVGAGWRNESLTATVTGLKLQEQTYHYRLVATSIVGVTYGQDQTIAPRSWSIVATPNPTGGTANTLRGVSCPTSTWCDGVGSYKNSTETEVSLGEHWNGTEWALLTMPNPTGGKEISLRGISCSSSTACTAVGSYASSAGVKAALAERWNGTEWTLQYPPTPSGGSAAYLRGVSCTTSTACTAVGYYYNSKSEYATLAEYWNGTTWVVQSSPNAAGAYNVLESVSCTSSTACTAVGGLLKATITERWNGTEWTIQKTNKLAEPDGGLMGVSCASSTACVAVGWNSSYFYNSGTPIAEGWNGTEWTSQTTASKGFLGSVSCTSSTVCTAVGGTSFSTGALAEGWTGTEWVFQQAATPTGAKEAELDGVSCTSVTSCTAVGRYTNSSGAQVTLAEALTP